MNKPSVSFIIPYYNVPLPLLARAVESVLRLERKVDGEVLVIDDGTPGHEAEDYLRSLGGGRVRYHAQPNAGLGGARNTGLEMARKEYVQFVDADDYLFPKAFSLVLDMLGEERPDLLSFGYRKTRDAGLRDRGVPPWRTTFRGSGAGFMLKHNLHGTSCGYVFRKSLLGGLRFTPGIYNEDEEFTPLLLLRARQVIATSIPAYAYFQRQGSITHNPDRGFIAKFYSDMQSVILRLEDERRRAEGEAAAALGRRIDALSIYMAYRLLCNSPDTDFLRRTLESMRQAGLYPAAPRPRPLRYAAVRWCTLKPSRAALLSRMLRLLRPRPASSAS